MSISKDPNRWQVALLALLVFGGYTVAAFAVVNGASGTALTIAAVVTWAVVQVLTNYGR